MDREFNEEKKDVKKQMWLLTDFSSSPSQEGNGELELFVDSFNCTTEEVISLCCVHHSHDNVPHPRCKKHRGYLKTTTIYHKYLDISFIKQNEVHLRTELLVLLFSIDLITFQRKAIGTHATNRLLAQKHPSASQFSCDQKNGMFLGDLYPRPDVFTPIIEKISSFRLASANL